MKQSIKDTTNNNYMNLAIIICLALIQVVYSNTNNNLKEKQTSLDNLDSEIKLLENKLDIYKDDQNNSQEKIDEIKQIIENEK